MRNFKFQLVVGLILVAVYCLLFATLSAKE